MARQFYINGVALVVVQGGEHLKLAVPLVDPDLPTDEEFAVLMNNMGFQAQELGLSSESITITPTFHHTDILADGYGTQIPAEVMWNLADARIAIDFINYDPEILGTCMQESMAGGISPLTSEAELLAQSSALMGNGLPVRSSGNHFVTMYITSPGEETPWVFPATYMTREPFVYPLGTTASLVRTFWRALPYKPLFQLNPDGSVGPSSEIWSYGAPLWHHGDIDDY